MSASDGAREAGLPSAALPPRPWSPLPLARAVRDGTSVSPSRCVWRKGEEEAATEPTKNEDARTANGTMHHVSFNRIPGSLLHLPGGAEADGRAAPRRAAPRHTARPYPPRP